MGASTLKDFSTVTLGEKKANVKQNKIRLPYSGDSLQGLACDSNPELEKSVLTQR
jgi:hypothetical protein